MYPNPRDVLPLPSRPDLGQYRKRAKDLARACKAGESAISDWAKDWVGDLLAARATPSLDADAERMASQVSGFAIARLQAADCALTQAQFVIARAHGFESWPRFASHLEAIGGQTVDSSFERAADAIIHGDVATLVRLLEDDPRLVQARSSRVHRATLLHYVAANGVENYRQVTPRNIVEVARLLIERGADVNATADMYGGNATTLGLAVTSAHPRAAGVQLALADLLLDRDARMDDAIIRACLMNGCPEAAEHLASRGASVGLLEAAGLGRADRVRREIDRVDPPQALLVEALMMAAWYGRVEVVATLLDHGLDPGVRDESEGEGQTALHIASYAGHPELVELLIRRRAPLDVMDARYGTPPVVWAMHAWLAENRSNADTYRSIIGQLVTAGARVRSDWLDDDRLRSDPEFYQMLVAASGFSEGAPPR